MPDDPNHKDACPPGAGFKGGVLNGLSVGFRPKASGVAIDARGRRTISRAKLLEISVVSVPANARCRVTETLAYRGGSEGLAERIARVDAVWAQDTAATRNRLAELHVKLAERIIANAAAGELAATKAAQLLTELRDGMRG